MVKFWPKSHQKQMLMKFLLLVVLLVGYFAYLSHEYGLLTGGMAAFLTWSFFVLCTPVADAGFLLDFPLRLLFGIRMVVSEVVVWSIACSLNVVAFFFFRESYQTTLLTRILEKILENPYPYWFVILLSALGTFLSIRLGDDLMDILHHKNKDFFHSTQFKHELVMIAFFILVFFLYAELIASLGINVDA